MGKFLKNFGLGLVYIILSPLLLAVIAVFGVYCLFVCLIEFFASAIRFFRGMDPFPQFEEDRAVEEIKAAQVQRQLNSMQPQQPTPQQPAGPSTVYVQQNYYQNGHHGQTPPPNPAPIDSTGFYGSPTNPTLQNNASVPALDDSSSQPLPLQNPNNPQLSEIPVQKPTAYIDISHDDDGKDNK
jgi:hypothetical protein